MIFSLGLFQRSRSIGEPSGRQAIVEVDSTVSDETGARLCQATR